MYEGLGDLARRVGILLAEQSAEGMPGHFGDELLEAFPESSETELKTALAELKAAGLIETRPLINIRLPRVLTTFDLFAAADPDVTGNDPRDDAIVLARMLIDDPKLGHVPALEAATGWPRRRFNPALGLIALLFRPNRVRPVDQWQYPELGLIVGEDEVTALGEYVRAHAR